MLAARITWHLLPLPAGTRKGALGRSGTGMRSGGHFHWPAVKRARAAPSEASVASSANQLSSAQLRALGLLPQPSLLLPTLPIDINNRTAVLRPRGLSGREDAPQMNVSARARPVFGPLSDQDRQRLVDELERDVTANSSAASSRSLLATWTRLHSCWFGPGQRGVPDMASSSEGGGSATQGLGLPQCG